MVTLPGTTVPGPRRKAPCVRRPLPCCQPEPRPGGAPAPLTGLLAASPTPRSLRAPLPDRGTTRIRAKPGRSSAATGGPSSKVRFQGPVPPDPRSHYLRAASSAPARPPAKPATPPSWNRAKLLLRLDSGCLAALQFPGHGGAAQESGLWVEKGRLPRCPSPRPCPCAAAGIEPPQEGTWTNFKMQQNSGAEASPGCRPLTPAPPVGQRLHPQAHLGPQAARTQDGLLCAHHCPGLPRGFPAAAAPSLSPSWFPLRLSLTTYICSMLAN